MRSFSARGFNFFLGNKKKSPPLNKLIDEGDFDDLACGWFTFQIDEGDFLALEF